MAAGATFEELAEEAKKIETKTIVKEFLKTIATMVLNLFAMVGLGCAIMLGAMLCAHAFGFALPVILMV